MILLQRLSTWQIFGKLYLCSQIFSSAGPFPAILGKSPLAFISEKLCSIFEELEKILIIKVTTLYNHEFQVLFIGMTMKPTLLFQPCLLVGIEPIQPDQDQQ
jgi:hypothetical protein